MGPFGRFARFRDKLKGKSVMCGVVGALLFRSSNFTIRESYITEMRDSMAHRGPDAAGTWVSTDGRVGLGHRRLSVIDLAEVANQPMNSADRSLWISFNGEIYNHAEIRSELDASDSPQWNTAHSDTEVILNAFRKWGIDCVHKLRGMFAFVLWDGRKRELWLVRDRIGIKPLYYSVHNNRIVFASQVNALLKDPDQDRVVDEVAFYHYLTFQGTPAPQTLLRGIKKVPPGTWLRVDESGTVREHRYWDVLDHTTPLVDLSEEEIAEQVLEQLRAAVNACKVSDIPLGMFLSSGIDSSAAAELLAEGEERPIRTFTIGNDGVFDGVQDETFFARQFAKVIGAEHHENRLTGDHITEFVQDVVPLQDEPISDPVCISIYHLSKLARETGVHVCLVGDGSDELFCGYPHYQVLLSLQKLNDLPIPRALKAVGLSALQAAGQGFGFPYERLRRGVRNEPLFWSCEESFTAAQKMRLLAPRLRESFKDYSSAEVVKPIHQRFKEKSWEDSHLNWMTYVEMSIRVPEVLVPRHDKMGMSMSVEARVPFLDHKVVELAMGIPAAVKTRNGTLKYILRKAMTGRLPNDVVNRGKGFMGPPLREWFLKPHINSIRANLDDFCDRTDLLDRAEAMRVVDEGNVTARLWLLLAFIWWWKAQVQGEAIEFH
jgi:asparagine synthase (glutamine-hydrolysing)